jgi:hypothetical protein
MFFHLVTIFSVIVSTTPVIASTSPVIDFEPISTEFMGNKAYLYTLEESTEVKTVKISFRFHSLAFYLFVHQCTFNNKNNRF